MQPDICVIGGGPAGLSAAIAFRLAGYSVIVFDANIPPIDKACGEGLMPDTLVALRQLGVHIPSNEGFGFRGIRFVHRRAQAQAEFPNDSAIGLRRTVLHRILAERASQLAIDLRWGVKGVRLTSDGVACGNAIFKPKLVVGADGLNSRVRPAAGLEEGARFARRFGFRRHYALEPWTDYVEIYWARRCQLYVTPIAPNEIGLALLTDHPHQRLDDALALFPQLARRLFSAQTTSSETGAITSTRRFRRVYRNGVALVGDASGSVDAITGEGVGLAVKQAAVLVELFRAGRLESYSRAHRKLARRTTAMSQVMLMLSRNETLQSSVIYTFGRFPSIFERLLAFHVGDYTSGAVTTSDATCVPRPNPECLNSQS